MKTIIPHVGALVVLGLVTLAPGAAFAQASTTTTITSTGTVSDWKPNAVAVKVDTSPAPVHYTFTKTTTYVDENGNPISVRTVRTGEPVTVFYERQGGALVADKVVVNRSVTTTTTAPAPVNVPPPVTTTTTTTADAVPGSPATNGVVTDAGDSHIDLRTSMSPKPIHYRAHDSTAYVDENGNPVSRKVVTEGTPVTVFYEQSGDDMFATRVVVRNPAVLDR